MTDQTEPFIPDEGHIIYTNFTPAAGHEQQGYRPAVVLSRQAYNQSGMLICVPMTTKARGLKTEIALNSYQAERGSVAIASQVQTIDWRERIVQHVGRATSDELYQIRYIIRNLIGYIPGNYKLP